MAVEEWDRRQLCPDGACTGLIGPSGTCKVCGHAAQNWGDERKRGMRNPTDAAGVDADGDEDGDEYDDDDEDGDEDGDEYEDEVEDEISPSAPAALGALGEWNKRQLCVDGTCVGVIGEDNTCKVCGKPGATKRTTASAKPSPGATASSDADLEAAAAELAASADPGVVASLQPVPADDDEDDDEEDDDEDEDEGDDEEEEEEEEDDAAASDSDEARELCPDGACVGVIGENRKCKLCGKDAA